jgi:branched-chain amino acid transport system substrate-binding protein
MHSVARQRLGLSGRKGGVMRAQFGRIAILVAALTLFAVLTGCGGSSEEKAGGKSTPWPNNTMGVTDTEIKVGTLMPMTGLLAAWGVAITHGEQAYFDYINDNGGLYGRKFKLIVGDSQYTGPAAIEAARKLVEQDGVFLLYGTLGTEVEAAVSTYLAENGVPDTYILSGSSNLTEPVAKNRFTTMVPYTTEGKIFATYIKQNYDGKKLGILAQNDEYGKEGEAGTRQGLKDLGFSTDNITTEWYDVAQPEVAAQTQRLKADNVDVIMFWGSPIQAASMMKTARETMSWDVPIIVNEANALDITAQLAGYDNIEGVISVTVGRQAWEMDVPGVAKRKELLAKYAPDLPFDNSSLVGWDIAESLVGNFKQAGKDLTRESFVAASESVCNYATDMSLVPSFTSPTDHRYIETEAFVKATVDRSSPAPVFKWVIFGDNVGFESSTDCTLPTPPPNATEQPGPPLNIEMKK